MRSMGVLRAGLVAALLSAALVQPGNASVEPTGPPEVVAQVETVASFDVVELVRVGALVVTSAAYGECTSLKIRICGYCPPPCAAPGIVQQELDYFSVTSALRGLAVNMRPPSSTFGEPSVMSNQFDRAVSISRHWPKRE